MGAKTRFEDVKHARVLRISRKPAHEQSLPRGSPHAPPAVRLGSAATRRRLKRESKLGGARGQHARDESGTACLAPVPEVTEPGDEQLELASPSIVHVSAPAAAAADGALDAA